ncbi:unnamed protein product [Gadus morhua 'NCC']
MVLTAQVEKDPGQTLSGPDSPSGRSRPRQASITAPERRTLRLHCFTHNSPLLIHSHYAVTSAASGTIVLARGMLAPVLPSTWQEVSMEPQQLWPGISPTHGHAALIISQNSRLFVSPALLTRDAA